MDEVQHDAEPIGLAGKFLKSVRLASRTQALVFRPQDSNIERIQPCRQCPEILRLRQKVSHQSAPAGNSVILPLMSRSMSTDEGMKSIPPSCTFLALEECKASLSCGHREVIAPAAQLDSHFAVYLSNKHHVSTR